MRFFNNTNEYRQGFVDGRSEGLAAVMLLRLAKQKFGQPSDAVVRKIQNADIDTLLDLGVRILDATHEAELLENACQPPQDTIEDH